MNKTTLSQITFIFFLMNGCVSNPIGVYLPTENDAGLDAYVDSGGDASPDGQIPPDVIIPDGCVPSTETCDGEDNNCNGLVDENFNLQSDILNCGECAHICQLPNASSNCIEGECTIRACMHDYWDVNHSSNDGCEYHCVESNNAVEICDYIDNNCNGVTDEGFDLQHDIQNCGSCGNTCSYSNANAGCNGSCFLQSCLTGWWNNDSNIVNGCEYRCDVTNNNVEICDGLDNNCDGEIDENYDLQNDPNNCGACGHVCSQNHAVSSCVAGQCEIQSCETDVTGNIHLYWDTNNDPSDGCEYFCQVSDGAHELCDGFDNNCNGQVDEFCNSLVMYLPFGDSWTLWPNFIYDKSGTGNNGEGFGGSFRRCGSGFVVTGEGSDNCCAEFIGTGYIRVLDSQSLEGFTQATWMLWIKPDNNTPVKVSLSKVGGYRFVSRVAGDYNFEYAVGSDTWTTEMNLSTGVGLNVWRLLTVVYNGAQMLFYLDGILMNQKNATGAIWSSAQNLYIGADGPATSLFSGNIDEVAIYTRAWSEGEIQRYFQMFF